MVVWTLTYCETCIKHQQRPFESPKQRSVDCPAGELDLGSKYPVHCGQSMDTNRNPCSCFTSMPILDCRDSNWHVHQASCRCWQDHALHYPPSRPEQFRRNSIPALYRSDMSITSKFKCEKNFVPPQTRRDNRQPEAVSSQQKRSSHKSEGP
jgi:hypothetical protein